MAAIDDLALRVDIHRLIWREDGRTVLGRIQKQAISDGHLEPSPDYRDRLHVTDAGRRALQAHDTTTGEK